MEWLAGLVGLWLVVDSLKIVREGLRFERHSKELFFQSENTEDAPKTSVIIAALNEEEKLPQCLDSLVLQDHPKLEVILINDRSTDESGSIMQAYCQKNERWKYVQIHELPEGWLGKTHALHQGSRLATGEYFIFSDADVVFSKDCTRKASLIASQNRIDHLSLGPRFIAKNSLLQAMLLYFGMMILRLFHPSRMGKRANAYVGVGAFNLVNAALYKELQGHESLRLCVLDDIMLAKLFSKANSRQAFVDGRKFLSIEWYASVGEMIRGLEKNSFAALRYSWLRLIGVYSINLLFHLLPYTLLLFSNDSGQGLLLSGLLLSHLVFAVSAFKTGYSPMLTFIYPLAGLLLGWTQLRSGILTSQRKEIRWRNTAYTVETLKSFAEENNL